MNGLWLWAVLALGSSPLDAAPLDGKPLDSMVLENGTLVFLDNCSSFVEFSTGDQMGHVALAFQDGGTTYVYEATPAQVRRVPVGEYCAELGRLNQRRKADEQIRLWLVRPSTSYSDGEAAQMREYLDAQLGRRYSVKNYVKSQPGDGIHCAELASTALNRSGRYAFEHCAKINPQALYAAVLPSHAAPVAVAVPPPAVKQSWCLRAQCRWAECCTWFGWSCREAWSLCW